MLQALVESVEQVYSLAVSDRILGELAHVQVVGDEIVDRADLAVRQLCPDLFVAWRRATTSRHISVGSAYSDGAALFHSVRWLTSSMPTAISGGSGRSQPFLPAS